MEIIIRLAKPLLILLVSLLLLTSLSCSDDPSSPQKKTEDPIPQNIVTIGFEGGTIEKDDFTITIPSGSFAENRDISVAIIEDDGAFGENTVSESFKINGLPSNFNKPIEIKSKYSGQLDGKTFLAIGQMARDVIEDDSSLVFNLFSAIDSAGILSSSIPAMSNSNLAKQKGRVDELETLDLLVKFLDSYEVTESDNFIIFYPLSSIQHVPKVKEMFQDAYGVVKHGLQKTFTEGLITRTIVILSQENPISVNLNTSIDNYLIHEFNISKESLGKQEYNDIQVRAVQELFYFTGRIGFIGTHWIVSAIYNWIEDWISDAPDYKYPKYLLENGWEPIWGFEGSNKAPEGYITNNIEELGIRGRGMSGLIKYLSQLESFGIAGLGKYAWELKSNTDITSDLLDEIGIPYDEWWPDFLKKYLNNELFDFSDDYFVPFMSQRWEINSEIDTLKIFTSTEVGKYQDLSAKIFKFDLNYLEFDNSQKINFEIDKLGNNNEVAIILFSISNGKINYIQTSNSKNMVINNLESFIENNGKQFLVMVVNNDITAEDYYGYSELDLSIRITPKKSDDGIKLDKDLCSIQLTTHGLIEHIRINSITTQEQQFIINTNHSKWDGIDTVKTISGSFDGNVFTGSFDDNDGWTQTASITLNDDGNVILDFSYEEIYDKFGNEYVREISGNNIPIVNINDAFFKLQGEDVCSQINTIQYKVVYSESEYSHLIDHWCEENSTISFQFFKE